jgi:hypothetical protein
MRSLFMYVKRSGVFRDPTARLPRKLGRRPEGQIPQRLEPSTLNALAGIHDSPTAWLIVVLAGHHALTANPIRMLRLDHVSLAEGQLRISDQVRCSWPTCSASATTPRSGTRSTPARSCSPRPNLSLERPTAVTGCPAWPGRATVPR